MKNQSEKPYRKDGIDVAKKKDIKVGAVDTKHNDLNVRGKNIKYEFTLYLFHIKWTDSYNKAKPD